MSNALRLRQEGATRWVVLILMSLLMFANYYLYDSYTTLKASVQIDLGMDSGQYMWMRSLYYWPNVFLGMALIGGIIMDRIGIRRTGFFFTVLCVLGGLAQAYGTSPYFLAGGFGHEFMSSLPTDWSPQVKMMILGRFMFGLGSETQIVMVNKVLAKWFKGKELALAFGLSLAMGRLGAALGMELSPKMAEWLSWSSALWLGAVIMLSGLVFFICYMLVDYRDEKRYLGTKDDAGALAADEEFHFKDVFGLLKDPTYVFIVLLCATFYAAVFPFQDLLADLLKHMHGFGRVDAGLVTSWVPWTAMVCTVIFAIVVDKKGKRTTLMIGGATLLTVCFFLFALTKVAPWMLVPLFGVAFSLVPAAMWPAVALIVKERYLGTAYGLMTWIQNCCLAAMTPLAGSVLDWTNPEITAAVLKAETGHYDYTWTVMMFGGIGVAAFVFSIGLRMSDRGPRSHGLELPSKEAAEFNARLQAEAKAAQANKDEHGTTP